MGWSDPLSILLSVLAATYALSLPYTAWLVRDAARTRR